MRHMVEVLQGLVNKAYWHKLLNSQSILFDLINNNVIKIVFEVWYLIIFLFESMLGDIYFSQEKDKKKKKKKRKKKIRIKRKIFFSVSPGDKFYQILSHFLRIFLKCCLVLRVFTSLFQQFEWRCLYMIFAIILLIVSWDF